MDFVGMFASMAENELFAAKVKEKFAVFCVDRGIPLDYQKNHETTWNAAAKMGAVILAEIIGETMEKHPYMAKQVMKMVGGDDPEKGKTDG